MLRKRKQPTPSYRLPPPYNAITGEHAPLDVTGVFPYVAMMQVAKADVHKDYVVCRGHDIRVSRFIDYDAGNANAPGIPCAKPYGNREVGTYTVGEIFPAVLPLQSSNPQPSDVPWRVGQNPGVAATSDKHPADLNETVEALWTDDDSQLIDWMLLDVGSGAQLIGGCLAQNHPVRGTVFGIWLGTWNATNHNWDYSETTYSTAAIDWRYGVPYPDQGATGLFTPRSSDTYGTIWETVALDCSVPETYSCSSGSLEGA